MPWKLPIATPCWSEWVVELQSPLWTKPVTVAQDTAVAEVDPNAPDDATKALRAGGDLPNVAIDPHTGELYVAYEGSDLNGGSYNSIELVRSTDGGTTWSTPKLINQAAGSPAFTPSITVDVHGTVAITYYDLRYLTADNTTTLPTAAWLLTFPRGAQDHPTERRISPVFDWLQAPYAGWGHFLGDYEGLTTDGPGIRPVLIETNTNAPQNSTDAYSGLLRTPTGHGPTTASPSLRASIPPAAGPHRLVH